MNAKRPLPVAVHRSETPLLKLLIMVLLKFCEKKITVIIITEALFFVLVSKLVYLFVLFCAFIKLATDQTGPPPEHSGRNRGFASQAGMYKVYKILCKNYVVGQTEIQIKMIST